MKKSLYFFASLLIALALFNGGQASAQGEDNAKAAKLGISFPIKELGNCGSVSECKSYCSNETNATACTAFAKAKGLSKDEGRSDNGALIKAAKSELGCDSEAACRTICSQEANIDKCSAFAQKHGLGGPPPGADRGV